MTQPEPTHAEWAALYQAATAFKQLAPWQWMLDSATFGVQNPEDGEIGYCSIMGQLGEHFALGVYRGSAGLDGYLQIQAGEFDPPDITALYVQKCLMASFEDRDFLEKPDLAIIKAQGLKFRGRNAWPLFRNYEPGYLPWFVTSGEARFLTLALQQALDVGQRYRDNPLLLDPPRAGAYLVRVVDTSGVWQDTWRAPEPLPDDEPAIPQFDELRAERIKRQITAREGMWDVDMLMLPDAVRGDDGGRPFFPYIFLWVDRQSGMVLPPQIAPPEDYQVMLQTTLLDMIEQAGFAPQEIGALTTQPLDLLRPLGARLGIKLRHARNLPGLEHARAGLVGYFLEDED